MKIRFEKSVVLDTDSVTNTLLPYCKLSLYKTYICTFPSPQFQKHDNPAMFYDKG